jgi:hypothetical protein
MFKNFQKLMYSKLGRYVISIILGFGLASLFRSVCKEKGCFDFKGPPLESIQKYVYRFNESCYKFNEEAIRCGVLETSVPFA